MGLQRRGRRVAVLATGLVLVAGGAAVGATTGNPFTDSTGAYHGCVGGGGNLRVLGAGEECKKNETAIDWNQAGQPGSPGADGVPGPKGDPGPSTLPRTFTVHSNDPVGGKDANSIITSVTLPQGWWALTASLDLIYTGSGEAPGDTECSVGGGQVHLLHASSHWSQMTVTAVYHVEGAPHPVSIGCYAPDHSTRARAGEITAIEVAEPTVQPAD